MFAHFQKSWKDLARGRPGRRFRDRFENRDRSGRGSRWRRLLNLGLALVCLVVGVALVFIPGPAVLFFFIGGGLLAAESRLVATLLDGTELRIRAIWSWVRRRWLKLPAGGKAMIGSLLAGAAMGGAYLSYRMVTA